MAYRVRGGESVLESVRRIAGEQIDKALGELRDDQLDRHETVHQVRKRCKKLRGLVRLVRPALGKAYSIENAWYRDAARGLSGVRDAQSIIETFDKLLDHFEEPMDRPQFNGMRATLVTRRGELAHEELDLDRRLREFESRLRDGHARTASWSLCDDGYDALAGGLMKTYERARLGMKTARSDPTIENYHEWRKRVKYNWYHHRLLRNAWKSVMNVRRNLLSELADLLGDDHDLSILRDTIVTESDRFRQGTDVESLLGRAGRRRKQLRMQALGLGAMLFAEKPDAFGDRIGRYWKASKLS